MTVLRTVILVDIVVTALAMTLVYNALHRDLITERLMTRSIRALKASDETLRLVIEVRIAEQEFLRSEDPKVVASLERTEQSIVQTAGELTALLREDGHVAEADCLRAQIRKRAPRSGPSSIRRGRRARPARGSWSGHRPA